ncbi:MAG TPA: transporter substrate-binding domain-containing protein [Clostridium sp.]
MKKNRIILVIAAATISLGLLAGCGKSVSSLSSSPKVIKVVGDAESQPFTYLDKDGKAAGYDIDVLKAINEKLPEYKFEYSITPADSSVVGVQSGKYKIGAGNYYKTPAREKTFLMEDQPMDYNQVSLAVRADDNSIKNLSDVSGKKLVPIPAADGLFRILSDYNTKNPNKQVACENIDGFYGTEGLKGIASKRWDAAIIPNVGYESFAPKLNLNLKLTEPISYAPAYYIFNKNQSELKTKFNTVLKQLLRDGTLTKISIKWYKFDVFKDALKK